MVICACAVLSTICNQLSRLFLAAKLIIHGVITHGEAHSLDAMKDFLIVIEKGATMAYNTAHYSKKH